MRKYLFSTHGRANRAKFWLLTFLAVGTVLANVAAVVLFEHYTYGQIGVPRSWDFRLVAVLGSFLPVYAVLLYTSVIVAIKRLHDRGKNGIWLLIILFAPFLLFAIDDSSSTSNVLFSAAIDLLGFAVWVWGFVELGILPGTDGNNIYGDDPVGAQSVPR